MYVYSIYFLFQRFKHEMKAIFFFFFVISYTTFESMKQSENKTIFVTSEIKMKKKQTIFKTSTP